MSFERFGNLPDLFTNIIFGVIIAISFDKELVKELFIPITNLLELSNFIDAIVIFFPIFFVVTKWVKYFEEYEIFPATISILGIGKTIINMILVGFIYQLFVIVPPQSGIPLDYAIVFVFPIINTLTMIMQIITFYEYKQQTHKVGEAVFFETEIDPIEKTFFEYTIFNSIMITAISIIISLVYIAMTSEYLNNYYLLFNNQNSFDVFFILAYYALYTWYYLIKSNSLRKRVKPANVG